MDNNKIIKRYISQRVIGQSFSGDIDTTDYECVVEYADGTTERIVETWKRKTRYDGAGNAHTSEHQVR